MTANNRGIPLAALLLAFVLTPRADATLTKTATFDDKVSHAAGIVLGRVVSQESKWDAGHRWILTYTTFRIEKSFKGLDAQQEITIVTPGGQVGDVNQDTAGVPEFVRGSDHVLFVRNSEAGPTVLYFDQGAYDVARNGSERLIVPVESDAVQIDSQRGMAVPAETPRTIAEFERAVRVSERRNAFNRMEVIKRQQQAQQPSAGGTFARYKYLIALALLGAAIATWQLLRR